MNQRQIEAAARDIRVSVLDQIGRHDLTAKDHRILSLLLARAAQQALAHADRLERRAAA